MASKKTAKKPAKAPAKKPTAEIEQRKPPKWSTERK